MATQFNQPLSKFVLVPALVFASYCACAIAALALTSGADGIATIWPSSGIAVAALILAGPGQRGAMIIAITLASFVANCTMDMSVWMATGFTIANVTEAVIAYCVMRGISTREESFYNLHAVARFCFAAVLAGTVSALMAGLFAGEPTGHFYLSWASTVSLGIMIVTPAILTMIRRPGRIKGLMVEKTGQWATLLISLLVAVTTLGVFAQSKFPLLFLPLVALLFATYLLGARGAIYSVLLIAVVGSIATWAGLGPINLIRSQSDAVPVLFFQFYLLTLLLSALPLAALLNTRKRQFEKINRTMRWLELSEKFSHVGHWRLDLIAHTIYWSREVFEIHGIAYGQTPPLEGAIDFYHPEDRAGVEAQIAASLETREPFEFDARLVRSDGEVRYVHSRGEVELEDGKPIAMFGIFQDVTDRVLATLQLAEARRQAELDASRANELAQTDSLTGIANRRKSMNVLEAQFEQARLSGGELTVAVLDIDHFKVINDTFGHAVGDEVIRGIARACCQTLRSSDLVGRIGGEEFVLILPGAAMAIALTVVERVRQAIEQAEWTMLDGHVVTASIGLSTYKAQDSAFALLQEADKALYTAKQSGRNRLCQAA